MQLLKDRNFNIAIAVSATWHLIFMFSISPVLIPVGIKQNSTKVSFLGSILEKVMIAAERSFSLERTSLMQKMERVRDIDSGSLALRPPEPAPKAVDIGSDKEEFVFFDDKDETVVFNMHHEKKERPGIRFDEIAISGEARNRMVLYRPELSKVSVFQPYFASDYSVSVKFKISRDGFIQRPELVLSSGSSEIDQMAIRYVRRWQFVPDRETPEGAQEGVVRVNF